MFKVLKRMARGYELYMTYRGRVLAREYLLTCGDRMLADNGFSRELLEKGVRGWPWRIPVEPELTQCNKAELAAQSQAIADLDSLSDTELQDLGITRGTIEQAVVFGREGVQSDHQMKAA
jgi:hypothetical protein